MFQFLAASIFGNSPRPPVSALLTTAWKPLFLSVLRLSHSFSQTSFVFLFLFLLLQIRETMTAAETCRPWVIVLHESTSSPSQPRVTSQSRVNLESSQIFFLFFLNRKKLFGYVLSTKRTINNRLTLVRHDRATPFCYGCRSFRIQVDSHTSRSFRRHDLGRFAYIEVDSLHLWLFFYKNSKFVPRARRVWFFLFVFTSNN